MEKLTGMADIKNKKTTNQAQFQVTFGILIKTSILQPHTNEQE
jgi:hypothetical protein